MSFCKHTRTGKTGLVSPAVENITVGLKMIGRFSQISVRRGEPTPTTYGCVKAIVHVGAHFSGMGFFILIVDRLKLNKYESLVIQ